MKQVVCKINIFPPLALLALDTSLNPKHPPFQKLKTLSDAYNPNSEIQKKEDKSTPEGWGGAFHLERL